jgi:hypothetical protein
MRTEKKNKYGSARVQVVKGTTVRTIDRLLIVGHLRSLTTSSKKKEKRKGERKGEREEQNSGSRAYYGRERKIG